MKRPLIIVLVLLVACSTAVTGCGIDENPPSDTETRAEFPFPDELSSTLVPDLELDVYAYVHEDRKITLPGDMVGVHGDVEAESLAIWGVLVEDNFAYGIGITLTSENDASDVYDAIAAGEERWKKLGGTHVYLVDGSGAATELLKTTISNNDFKEYDDSDALGVLATLPPSEEIMLSGVGVVKPTMLEASGFMGWDNETEGSEMIDMLIQLADIEVLVGGLYSVDGIDVTEIMGILEGGGTNGCDDCGEIVVVKSGFAGFVVEPAVKVILEQAGFTESSISGITIYEGSMDTGNDGAVPLIVRVEGNHIFVVMSEQRSIAETLVVNIQK